MPIPALTADGWLPPGEHACTLQEVEARFASPESTPQRRQIFQALSEHLRQPIVLGHLIHVLIDGSFVGVKTDPKDVDIVLGLRRGTIRGLLHNEDGVDGRTTIKSLEGAFSDVVNGHRLIHGFADDIEGPKYAWYQEHFQQSDRVGEPPRKGILIVRLQR